MKIMYYTVSAVELNIKKNERVEKSFFQKYNVHLRIGGGVFGVVLVAGFLWFMKSGNNTAGNHPENKYKDKLTDKIKRIDAELDKRRERKIRQEEERRRREQEEERRRREQEEERRRREQEEGMQRRQSIEISSNLSNYEGYDLYDDSEFSDDDYA